MGKIWKCLILYSFFYYLIYCWKVKPFSKKWFSIFHVSRIDCKSCSWPRLGYYYADLPLILPWTLLEGSWSSSFSGSLPCCCGSPDRGQRWYSHHLRRNLFDELKRKGRIVSTEPLQSWDWQCRELCGCFLPSLRLQIGKNCLTSWSKDQPGIILATAEFSFFLTFMTRGVKKKMTKFSVLEKLCITDTLSGRK